MKKAIVAGAFLAGSFLGSAVVYYWFGETDSVDSPAVVEDVELERLRRENARLRQEVEGTQAATEKPFAQSASSQAISLSASGISEEEQVKRLEAAKRNMKRMMDAKASERLDTLVRRLGLSEEQREAFAELFELQAEQLSDIKVSFVSGGASLKMNRDKESFVSDRDFENLAREVLSGEQLDSFLEMQEEERQAKWDTVATSRLNRIAPALGMTEEEKDQVYGIYFEEARRMAEPMSPEARAELETARNEQMRELLGAERFEAYLDLGKSDYVKRIELRD
ncbi:hypothetical protein [Pelagicoccus mobilis]|uniref:Uncharacterized protein n=1 Tax=Pelagicoccus mobilis TaxID=415221 RepID=A0A934S1C8_9BACT|nr:hypothetical protein [Pelagicoccus mobilis]MBK1880123.1 hypothetical protein [Pelagicoccus mobilis]